MEIFVAAEQAFQIVPQISLEIARDRVEHKKTSLVAGAVGALFGQAKADDIRLLATENRLEPFWLAVAASRTTYDRNVNYSVAVGATDVSEVTLLGQRLSPTPQPRGGNAVLHIAAVEHCVQSLRTQQIYDGIGGHKADLARYVAAGKREIADLTNFADPGVLVVPPQVRASAVVRLVTAEVFRPVQNAQHVHEERVDIETVALHFRPVYALEYEWASKNKRLVVEFDAVTGDMKSGGKRWSDQIKGIVTSDLLFDVTADAMSMVLPGGGIAVRLVKAVVDRER